MHLLSSSRHTAKWRSQGGCVSAPSQQCQLWPLIPLVLGVSRLLGAGQASGEERRVSCCRFNRYLSDDYFALISCFVGPAGICAKRSHFLPTLKLASSDFALLVCVSSLGILGVSPVSGFRMSRVCLCLLPSRSESSVLVLTCGRHLGTCFRKTCLLQGHDVLFHFLLTLFCLPSVCRFALPPESGFVCVVGSGRLGHPVAPPYHLLGRRPLPRSPICPCVSGSQSSPQRLLHHGVCQVAPQPCSPAAG